MHVPPVGLGCHEVHRLWTSTTDDEGDLPDGCQRLARAPKPEELTVVVDRLPRPEGFHDLDRFTEPSDAHPAGLRGYPKGTELVLPGAPSDPQLEATVREAIKGDRLLGQHGGVTERVGQDERADHKA